MKILNIYVSGSVNHLTIPMIDYLIDAGHRVFFSPEQADVCCKKLTHHTHNIFVLKPEQLMTTPLDYQLNFTKSENLSTTPSLELAIYNNQHTQCLASYIQDGSQLSALCNEHINFNSQESNNESLCCQLIALFTDSIIHLSKYSHQELADATPSEFNNSFGQLVDYYDRIELLEQFYQYYQDQEDLFSLPEVYKTDLKNYHIPSSLTQKNPEMAEWFMLYLLAQLNSRKMGIYCYDYHTDGRSIKKCIEINQQDNFKTIKTRINHPCYKIYTNPFYHHNSQSQNCRVVLIDEADNNPTSLHITLDEQNRLSICYDKSLYLLNQTEAFFNTFNQYWQDFKEQNITFYQFLNRNEEQIYETVKTFNPAKTTVPEQTIDYFFEQQTNLHKNHSAIECVDGCFTYQELNDNANQLAHYLNQKIKLPNRWIGIYLKRTSALIISILAILKSGHAYIPLDTNIPDERLITILEDCTPDLVITTQSLAGRLHGLSYCPDTISLNDTVIATALTRLPTENPDKKHTPQDLAYIIYTSGTTGKPKGVMIEHQALANTLTYFQKLTELTPTDRLLALTTIAFDIAALEIFMPLMTGCTVIFMPREDILNIPELINEIQKKSVTIMQATPSLWSLISQELEQRHLPVRALCGGEALPLSLAAQLGKQVDKLFNVYGPTETTIWSSVYEYKGESLYIGKPIANTHCYVLDDQMHLLPVGAVGELYIGGKSLARGYYCQPELTKNKFIMKPDDSSLLAFTDYERLYKTGDLVRYTEDGLLEYFGRNDFQIKIRGHRIELSEIEQAILSIDEVKQAVAIVISSSDDANDLGNIYLLGYYVSEYPLDEIDMIQQLKAVLPDYMCPNVLIHLNKMPLSINGKINYKKLPLPNLSHALQQAPLSHLELQLCELFKTVLNLPTTHRANIYDNFFNLGGNSISGIKLVNEINRQLSSDINIRDLFFEKSIINIAKKVKKSQGKFALKEYMVTTSDQQNLYQEFPMTNVQQTYYLGRFDYFELSNVSTHVYTEFKYKTLDVSRLEKAFNILLQRHMALRTVFTESTQRFLKDIPYYHIPCHFIESAEELNLLREQYSHKVYQPSVYPLFDIVISCHKEYYLLHISFDAIIVDMSSFEILFGEWIKLYQNLDSQLPQLSFQFRDYVIQHERIRSGDLLKQAKSYWLHKLDDYHLEMKLPLKIHPSQVSHPRFKRLSKTIEAGKWQTIKEKAQSIGVSLTAVIVEVFGQVLSYWSNQEKLAINLTLFNRLPIHEEVNKVIGDFTALELFAYAKKQANINQILEETHQKLLTDIEHNLFDGIDFQRLLRQHHEVPANSIVSPVVLTSVLGGNKQSGLFNLPLDNNYQGIEYAISQTAQVWLDNKAYEDNDGFVAEWDYVSQLFDEHVITNMYASYCYLIESLAILDWSNDLFPRLPLASRDLRIIEQANETNQALTEDTLISSCEPLFNKPHLTSAIAVIDDERQQTFTHQKLWHDSGNLAKHLVKCRSTTTLIGILSEKGYNLPLGTLGIMRSGHAYLPLHVDWPTGRIDEVLKQGGVKILLVSAKIAQQTDRMATLKQHYNILVIEELLTNQTSDTTLPEVKPDDIAYVIFTSGSTGKPKGVTINHKGALNTINAVNETFKVNHQDSILALSELSFDLSVYDIFGLLSAGGTIVYPKQEDSKEPQTWLKLIKQHNVSLWNTVPQLAGLLTDEPDADISSIRLYLLSGDWIPVSLPDKLKQLSPNTQVISLGGATEGSIWSIWYPIENIEPAATSIPYGRAMPNQKMYVLNEDGQHCPIGVIGEIHIGGMGVALNYWDNEEITQKHFFHHPKLGRLYKTGDLGRWHQNGYIEFCGRADFQVKINGYRIELGEIEHVLNAQPDIKKAVVVIKKQEKHSHIVAYYVSQTPLNHDTISATLNQKLPNYMVPDYLFHLDALPLSPNGKLDTKALPEPRLNPNQPIIPPRNELEENLSELWRDLLKLENHQFNIHDDFFQLGGDSIGCIQLVSRIRQELHLKISVKDIFAYRTLSKLADFLSTQTNLDQTNQEPKQPLTGTVPLLPVQNWFFNQKFTHTNHWNQAFVIKTEPLDIAKTQKALGQLVQHHDALRLRFVLRGDKIEQYYDAQAKVPEVRSMDVAGLDNNELSKRLTGLQSHFDLEHGPLFTVCKLTGYPDGSQRLFLAFHHLIMDTISFGILVEDLYQLYHTSQPLTRSSSYRQWVEDIASYNMVDRKGESAFWQNIIANLVPGPWLKEQEKLTEHTISLDKTLTQSLMKDCHYPYQTETVELLLTALGMALSQFSHQSRHHITMESHGRGEINDHTDINRTVGWFTCFYPVVLDAGDDLKTTLIDTKDFIRSIPNNGMGFGPLTQYASDKMPDISFNFFGNMDFGSAKAWPIVHEQTGVMMSEDNHDHFKLKCFGGIANKQLSMTFKSYMHEEHNQALANLFKQALKKIIKHTLAQKRKTLTLSDINHIISKNALIKLQEDQEIERIYLANSLQQGFIYHALNQGHVDDAYRVQIIYRYNGGVKLNVLRQAWANIQKRYPVLRMRLVAEEELLQVFDKHGQLNWKEIDLTAISDEKQKAFEIERLALQDRQQPYQLASEHLFRIKLIKLQHNCYTCIFNIHHSIIDGWSSPILLHEVHKCYHALIHNQSYPITVDNVYYQAQAYLQKAKDKNKTFWAKYTKDITPSCHLTAFLKTDKKDVNISQYKHIKEQANDNISLSGEDWHNLKNFSQEHGITLNAITLFAWHKVLSFFSNTSSTIIGPIVSGRNIPIDGVEESVGLYINTLPMIVNHEQLSKLTILQALQAVQENSNKINNHCEVHLASLQKNGERLFDILFMFGNYPDLSQPNSQQKLTFQVEKSIEKRDYPLSLAVDDLQDRLEIKVSYAKELFDANMINRLLASFKSLIKQTVSQVTKSVMTLQHHANVYVPKLEQSMLYHKTFVELFEQAAANYPEKTALIMGERSLTYKSLNQQANQLAHYLKQHHAVGYDDLVIVKLPRSPELMIALLAIMKTGGAYIPVDYHIPEKRYQAIAENSQAKLSLGDHVFAITDIDHFNPIEDRTWTVQEFYSQANPNMTIKPEQLAYVIYTSGTTGVPKGVMISHRAFATTIKAFHEQFFHNKPLINTVSVTQAVFDIFGLEYGLPLCSGGQIVLSDAYTKHIDCHCLDFVQMTPGVYAILKDKLTRTQSCKLLIGGEALSLHIFKEAQQQFTTVINVYGPTETTIWSTARLYSHKESTHEVSIGLPFKHETAYVLDKHLNPVPTGVAGELYIGGLTLARGYLRDLKQTQSKFIKNPWQTGIEQDLNINDRLYKTGDLVRQYDDGQLVFLGRTDFQVKFNGHRIELADIESAILSYPGILQSVVNLDASGFVAYYRSQSVVVENDLKHHLQDKLPDYMIPQYYMQLDVMPLNPNGKIDRKALPELQRKAMQTKTRPGNKTESMLVEIWSRVLNIDEVGIYDNFFDLGGNSILLIKLFSQLPEAVKDKIAIVDLFKYTNIACLAELLDGQTENKYRYENFISDTNEDIAIIGMAGRFPGADNIGEFWDLLTSGKEAITRYSHDELVAEGISADQLANPNYVKAQSKIKHIRCFDAEFFGYTPSEAKMMDPQHRIFMECVWHALEDGHYNPTTYPGRIGLYAGCGQNQYFQDYVLPNQEDKNLSRQFQMMIHSQANFLCTKVAYKLNLTGPAMTIQTACSTSLVAVHQACAALKTGDCDMALAGGVSLGQLEKQGYLYEENLIFSPDGTCRAFDESTKGTFEGQGAGVVLLKPVKKALEDDDFIYAVIKGSAINNDGKEKIGFTAPSPTKQTEVINLALQRAEIKPEQIGYIETHGTGTPLGDQIELSSLNEIFKDSKTTRQCAIGSVKTNIGHLDVAAGVVGLIKATLCLHHKELVPSLHFNKLNSANSFGNSHFYVNTKLQKWHASHTRVAGVSAFGIGGTNAHIVLAQPPAQARTNRLKPALYPFARTEYWYPAKKDIIHEKVITKPGRDVQTFLTSCFQEILGINNVEEQDDFFELGGDSLSVVQLTMKIKKELNQSVELMSLDKISIAQLTAILDDNEPEYSAKDHIVVIKEGLINSSCPPIVLVHPVGGDIFFYRDFANAMPAKQRIIAMRCPELYSGQIYQSIEEMAKCYLEALKAWGLTESFIPAGSSFGGAVALEMAQRLTQIHAMPKAVIMIDTPAHTNLPKVMTEDEILTYLLSHGLAKLEINQDSWANCTSTQDKIDCISKAAQGTIYEDMLSSDFLPIFLKTWQHNARILNRYRAKTYPGQVIFFAHSESMSAFPDRQPEHWQKIISGPFKHFNVPGNHISMIANPNVKFLATYLKDELNRICCDQKQLTKLEKDTVI